MPRRISETATRGGTGRRGAGIPWYRDIPSVVIQTRPRLSTKKPSSLHSFAPSPSFVDSAAPRDGRPAPQRGQPRREQGGRADSRGKPRAPAQAASSRKPAARDANAAGQQQRDGKPPARPRADAPRQGAATGAARPGRPSHQRRDERDTAVRSNLPPGWK